MNQLLDKGQFLMVAEALRSSLPIDEYETLLEEKFKPQWAQPAEIHGTFREHELEDASAQIIITEEDNIEFLTVVGIQNVGVPNLIAEKIVDSTLLFLGYGLEDWDFRTIFKGLIERLPPRTQRKSFAIQKDPPDFWVEFWKKKNVEIYNMERPPARTGPAVRDKLERITSRRGHAIRALRLAASQ